LIIANTVGADWDEQVQNAVMVIAFFVIVQ
jgi:hypothetical protein